MMHPLYCGQSTGSLPVPYSQENMFDDLSRQMAVSQSSRRLSKGSTGQRSGTAMRVMKPSSANSSPRSSGAMARRKTVMNDYNAQRLRQQALEQLSLLYGSEEQPRQMQQASTRPSRPLSWHPNMYHQQSQPSHQQPMYPVSANMYAEQQDLYACHPHLSPMLPSYSSSTSPASAFSPLSLPFQTTGSMSYIPPENVALAQQVPVIMAAPQLAQETYSNSDESNVDNTAYSNSWDWNSFIMQGFNSTSPPTPEAFPQVEHSQPAMCEQSIPYQPLEESTEDEGEILIGMGLYDTPDKFEDDPQLNNYRSTVSSLLGSTFRRPEPKGKGLKLEETWEPPKSDDEDDGEEDEEEEAEDGDEEEEKE
ncbi:hypothetical protein BGZ63DRAFT_228864 [Mariannaea sp. PMI_226]|nr:hypothetical protein BGZ63DRAFT_228864 [Mariannaea sp. PMI_226]